mgnify:CR=1 FL=1
MPKIPAITPKQIIKKLKKIGFADIRMKGSHVQLKKGNLLVTVPFHNGDLKAETLKSILRQAKMTIEELIAI